MEKVKHPWGYETASDRVDFKVKPSTKAAMKAEADKVGRSVANYLIWLHHQHAGTTPVEPTIGERFSGSKEGDPAFHMLESSAKGG